MGSSIGTLSLQLEVDAKTFTDGLALSRSELRLHKEAMKAAAEPTDDLAAAERQLGELMKKNPAQADAYAKALQKMRAEIEATAQAERDAAKAKADAIEAVKAKEAERKAEIEQRRAERAAEIQQAREDRAAELAAMRMDRANDMAAKKAMFEQARQDRAVEIATARLDRVNELAQRKAEAEQAANLSRAKSIIERDATAGEKYAANLAELNRLRIAGALTADQHARAVQREQQALRDSAATSKNAVDGWIASMSPANLAIAGVATVTATASAAVYGFANNLKTAISRIDETADAAANLGVAPEQFDRLRKAALLADAPVEGVATLLDKVQTKVSEAASGEQGAAQAFHQIGLNATELKRIAPEKQFEAVAAAISRVHPSDQIRVMKDIFGKSAADSGNLIRNFSEINSQLDKMGVALKPEAFAAIGQVDDASKRLALTWNGLFDAIAVEAAPALSALLDEITSTTSSIGEATAETTTLSDAIYSVRDAVVDIRDNWEAISQFIKASVNITQMITSPGTLAAKGIRQGADVDAIIAEQRAIDRITREENAKAAAQKRAAEDAQKLADRRELLAEQKATAGGRGQSELERMLQARRDELELLEKGKEALEIDRAVRAGANEAELAELAEIRQAEAAILAVREREKIEREHEAIHRQAVISLIDRAIAAEEKLLTPQERLNEMIAQQAELVNAGLLDEAKALELVRREAASIKSESSSGIAAMTAGSQAFVAAVAKRESGEQQTELQRKAVEELKKLVKKDPVEIVVMKAGA